MSASPDRKPPNKLTLTVDVQSETHGIIRLRKWTASGNTKIRRLSDEHLGPREFVERLLCQQAVEPLLREEALAGWTDAELTAVAIGWWRAVEGPRPSPIAVNSLADLRAAVRQRIDAHSATLGSISASLGNLNFRMHELNSIERRATDLAKQTSLLNIDAVSAVQNMIQRIDFEQSSCIDQLNATIRSNSAHLAFAALQERIREATLVNFRHL